MREIFLTAVCITAFAFLFYNIEAQPHRTLEARIRCLERGEYYVGHDRCAKNPIHQPSFIPTVSGKLASTSLGTLSAPIEVKAGVRYCLTHDPINIEEC